MSPDIHTLTGVYAVNALDAQERADFEQHVASCAACQAEVRELQATAARLSVVDEEVPPAPLKASVMAAIRQTRQLPPATDVVATEEEVASGATAEDAALRADRTPVLPANVVPLSSRSRRWRTPLAAAAAALVLLAGGEGVALVAQQHRLDQQENLADGISRVLAAPDHTLRTAEVDGGGLASVVAANGEAVVMARGLSTLPQDKTYQVWVIRDGQPRSAGLMGAGAGTASLLVRDVRPGDALGVTVEPAGGSRQPTTKPVVVVQA